MKSCTEMYRAVLINNFYQMKENLKHFILTYIYIYILTYTKLDIDVHGSVNPK